MSRPISALIAAIVVTALIGAGMYMMGNNALVTADVVAASTQSANENQQILGQYQTQEAQCSSQISSAAQRIATANQQIQQYQSILNQLQEQGLITIAKDGTVTINQQVRPQ